MKKKPNRKSVVVTVHIKPELVRALDNIIADYKRTTGRTIGRVDAAREVMRQAIMFVSENRASPAA